MGIPHDSAFRELFAHPEAMRELVTSLLPQAWSAQMDLSSLERVNASYADNEGAQRHSDMVWRVLLSRRWLASARSEELRRTVLAWIRSSLPAAQAGSRLDVEEVRDMLILRFRTPDFDTADQLWRYNITMKGMEDVLTQQLRKKFGEIPPDYAWRLRIAIDKDFKVYADRIFDAKTIGEVFEPDPAEDE